MKLMAQRRIQSSCATVLIAAGAALALPATAQAGSVLDIAYTVDVAGATVLNAQYRTEINANGFESALFGKTSGVSDMFAGYKMNLSATGRVTGGKFLPGIYANDRKKKGKKAKSTDITWSSAGEVAVAYKDEPMPLPPAVAAALRKNSSDPLTAILKMANSQQDKPCSGKYRVYDGKDVFDLSLAFQKNFTLASTGNGDGLECRLTWTPVAGVAVDRGETDAESYALSLVPVKLSSGKLMHVPMQIVGKNKGMTVTVSASSVTVDGQAVNTSQSQ
jgi:hypothetical protein